MNRKTAIKSIMAFVLVGGATGALYEFIKSGQTVPIKLLPQKKQLIAELAETIIPRTDTPGAKDAKVEEYIIKMIMHNTDAKAQKSFSEGLSALEHYTSSKYDKLFIHCNQSQKTEILKYFEQKGDYSFAIIKKVNKKLFGNAFFFQLRDLVAEGYSTSFLGATKGMAYDYIPITFEACVPLKKNQLAWAIK